MKLGMLLEVATAGGSFLGGVTAQLIGQSVLQKLFGVGRDLVAIIMLTRLRRRNVILDPTANRASWAGGYYEEESGCEVTYRVKRLPVAIVASFIAGNVSSLLGIGGGIIKVPVLNAWCGIPLRAAAATSAFMIGVTATAGAVIYYGLGQLEPALAAAAVLGVQLGSWAGMRFGAAAPVKWLKVSMAVLLFIVSAMMLARSGRMKLERAIAVVLRAGVTASSACSGARADCLDGRRPERAVAHPTAHGARRALFATPVAARRRLDRAVRPRSATGRSRL